MTSDPVSRLQRDRERAARTARSWREVRASARAAGLPDVIAHANAEARRVVDAAPPRPSPANLVRLARAWHSWAANPRNGNDPWAVFEREARDAHAHDLIRAVRDARQGDQANVDEGVWEVLMGDVTPAEFTARQARPLTAAVMAREIARDAADTGFLRGETPLARRTLIATLRRALERQGG